jgi:hypothetical protein
MRTPTKWIGQIGTHCFLSKCVCVCVFFCFFVSSFLFLFDPETYSFFRFLSKSTGAPTSQVTLSSKVQFPIFDPVLYILENVYCRPRGVRAWIHPLQVHADMKFPAQPGRPKRAGGFRIWCFLSIMYENQLFMCAFRTWARLFDFCAFHFPRCSFGCSILLVHDRRTIGHRACTKCSVSNAVKSLEGSGMVLRIAL